MKTEENLHELKKEFESYIDVCGVYHDTYIALCALLTDNAVEEAEKKHRQGHYIITDIHTQVTQWVDTAERHLSEQFDTKSSRSSRSSRSSKSSWSSYAREKVRLAELVVE